jgi:phage repressor protein C with HTH and peptisase S24 domain
MLGMDGYFDALDYPVGHGDGHLAVSSKDPNAYALRVMGSSMTPRIKNGEFVLVEPNLPYASGDDVLIRTKNGRAMIKEFIYLCDGQYRFDSYGPGHDPIYINESEVEKVHFVGGIFKSYRYSPE